jgi:hypothetical protein
MNRDIENLTLNFLAMPYEDGYIAMCKETGIIRSGKTLGEARDAIISSTEALIGAVADDIKLLPSLHVGLPLKYRALFNWTVFKILCRFAMDRVLYETNFVRNFHPDFALGV